MNLPSSPITRALHVAYSQVNEPMIEMLAAKKTYVTVFAKMWERIALVLCITVDIILYVRELMVRVRLWVNVWTNPKML